MSIRPPREKTDGVTLVRPGVGSRTYDLPPGATLADLLREANATNNDQVVTIDERPIEEQVILEPGSVVVISPRVRNSATEQSWRQTVGSFPDDADFQEMVDAGRAFRQADDEAGPNGRQGDGQ